MLLSFLPFPTPLCLPAWREIERVLTQFLSPTYQPLLPLQAASEPSPAGQAEAAAGSSEQSTEPTRHIFSFSWLNSLTE